MAIENNMITTGLEIPGYSIVQSLGIVRGLQVENIMSMTSIKPHTLTPWAVVKGTQITYPAQ